MKKIIHKGDDFLSIEETIGDIVTSMNLVTINDENGDVATEDFVIEVHRIRNKEIKIRK